MLLGQYQIPLDDDGFVVIPQPFSEIFTDGAYLTCGFEQNLLVMSSHTFEEIYKRLTGLNIADPQARLLQRLMLGNAVKLEPDQAGQVLIPQSLKTFAGLENQIVLVGQGNFYEIWSPAGWDKQNAELLNFDKNANRFASLDLALC